MNLREVEDLMRRTVLWTGALLVSLFSLTGCKSDMEKYADDVCACSDSKCVEEVGKKWEGKFPKGEGDKAMKDMNEKDKEAFGKALACAFKHVGK